MIRLNDRYKRKAYLPAAHRRNSNSNSSSSRRKCSHTHRNKFHGRRDRPTKLLGSSTADEFPPILSHIVDLRSRACTFFGDRGTKNSTHPLYRGRGMEIFNFTSIKRPVGQTETRISGSHIVIFAVL